MLASRLGSLGEPALERICGELIRQGKPEVAAYLSRKSRPFGAACRPLLEEAKKRRYGPLADCVLTYRRDQHGRVEYGVSCGGVLGIIVARYTNRDAALESLFPHPPVAVKGSLIPPGSRVIPGSASASPRSAPSLRLLTQPPKLTGRLKEVDEKLGPVAEAYFNAISVSALNLRLEDKLSFYERPFYDLPA